MKAFEMYESNTARWNIPGGLRRISMNFDFIKTYAAGEERDIYVFYINEIMTFRSPGDRFDLMSHPGFN